MAAGADRGGISRLLSHLVGRRGRVQRLVACIRDRRRGAWTDRRFLRGQIPHEFTVGRTHGITWQTTVNRLHALDPHEIFTSPLLRTLMRPRG
jgi:hypothetical protein